MLFCENLNSTKLRMKHLGGNWLYGLCWVATHVHFYGEYVHLRTATQEQRNLKELQVTIASSAAIAIWALAWSIMLRGLSPAWQADVGGC